MVYCTKCGTQNIEGDIYCSNCGSPLTPTQTASNETRYERRAQRHQRRMERQGARQGYAGLFIGALIILVGLFLLVDVYYDINFPWWTVVVIVVGVMLVLRWVIATKRSHIQ